MALLVGAIDALSGGLHTYFLMRELSGVTREFTKGATRRLRDGWMEGNFLRLMPGLSLEDRKNW